MNNRGMFETFQIQARFLVICLLFLSLVLKSSANNVEEYGNLLPPSGFVQAGSGLGSLTLRILSRKRSTERKIRLCQYLTIVNPPKETDTPLVGPNIFELNSQQSVDGHFTWSNGNESLFFVPLDRDRGGNWLFGPVAGVDSGYVYLPSAEETLSPLEILPGKQWKWLLKTEWIDQPQMYLDCVTDLVQRNQLRSRVLRSLPPNNDPAAASQSLPSLPKYQTSHYYTVEFFHPVENLLTTGLILVDFPIEDFTSLPHLALPVTEQDFLEAFSDTPEPKYGLLDLDRLEYVSLRDVEVVTVFGSLHSIETWTNSQFLLYSKMTPEQLSGHRKTVKDSRDWGSSHAFNRKMPVEEEQDNPFSLQLQESAILLNVEHTNLAWRATYRVVNQYLPKRNTSNLVSGSTVHSGQSEVEEALSSSSYPSAVSLYFDYYYPGKWSSESNPEKIDRVLAPKEYLVEIANRGIVTVNDEKIDDNILKNRQVLEITPLLFSLSLEEDTQPEGEEKGSVSEEEEEEEITVMEIAGEGSIVTDDPPLSSSSALKKNKKKKEKQRPKSSEMQHRDWQLFYRNELLPDLREGDFLWLWYTTATGSSSSERVEELLVKLRFNYIENYYFFEVYPTHRTEQMRQTPLEKTQSLLLIPRRPPSESSSGLVQGKLNGREIAIHSMVAIPKAHLLRFILSYLLVKEKVLNQMSTCFFYHAAVTLPQALIYAAEILCVVIGSKPIALIQYSSPSEHQWKFPLVQELSEALVMLQALREEVNQRPSLSSADSLIRSLRINSTVFAYQSDETLVFYHQDAALLLYALLPVNKTQALHPLPYELPETASQEERSRVWKEQVFNAAWNGLVLGYPSYFVSRYCEDFHNPLSIEHKAKIFEKALRRYHKFLEKIQFSKRWKPMQQVEIQYGLFSPMNKLLFAVLNQRVTQSL